MPETRRVPAAALTAFTEEAIRTLGAPGDIARVTAEALVAADLRGIFSHGVAGGTGLLELVERTRAGAIEPATRPALHQREGWAAAVMDGRGGIGPAAAMEGAMLAGDLAGKYGAGRVHVYNANHFGAACVYVEALIARGFAARATCTSGAWLVPYGGERVRLGTNPIAWGIPCGDEPIVIDIATTQRAVSPAIRCARAGEPIPPDYFVDEKGRPLEGVVPYEKLIQGSVRPLGGERFGYKGSGLNILVELDNVMGGGSTGKIPSMRETPRSRVSQTFEAWRIDLLFPEAEARRRLAEAVADIRRHGGPGMLMPGEREARHKADAEKHGIPYGLSQWETLRKLGADTGVKPPAPLD
ncbi:MAG: Ldh family oxidoreductase [Nitrospinota bacterium]